MLIYHKGCECNRSLRNVGSAETHDVGFIVEDHRSNNALLNLLHELWVSSSRSSYHSSALPSRQAAAANAIQRSSDSLPCSRARCRRLLMKESQPIPLGPPSNIIGDRDISEWLAKSFVPSGAGIVQIRRLRRLTGLSILSRAI